MRSGRRRETPTMGVVVAVPTDANSTSRLARWFSLRTRAGVGSCGKGSGRAAGVLRAASTTRLRPWAAFGLHSLRRSESAVVARVGGAAQARLARASSREPGEKAGFGCRRLPGTVDMPDL
jgi:hypothetical protein